MDSGYVELGKKRMSLRAKGNSYDREQPTSNAEPPVEPKCTAMEQPKGVLQKNLKTLLYLGAALLVIVAAIFSATGKKTPAQKARQIASTAADVSGQHRQQRAGSEKPGEGRTRKGAAVSQNGCRARSGARVRDAASRQPPRPMGRPAKHPLPAVQAGPAGKRTEAPCPRNLLPRSNKRKSLPRESANGLG